NLVRCRRRGEPQPAPRAPEPGAARLGNAAGRRDAPLCRERDARTLAYGWHARPHPGALGALLAETRGGNRRPLTNGYTGEGGSFSDIHSTSSVYATARTTGPMKRPMTPKAMSPPITPAKISSIGR